VHLLFGDVIDDEKVYVMQVGRPHVFLTDYDFISHFFRLNVFAFINRFIIIEDIYTCLSIDITSPDRTYRIELDQYTVPVESQFREATEDNEFNAFVNGQPVQDLAFKTFYQLLIGITYDTDIGYDFEPEGEPEYTVTFTLTEKGVITARYYPFNANFYAVRVDDGLITHLTNRQGLERMINALPELMAGNMDREF
jgi:hypothetical protein